MKLCIFCVVIFIHSRVLLLILRYYVGSIMNEVYTPVLNTAVFYVKGLVSSAEPFERC